MKGTWRRGNNAIVDMIEKRKFYHDQKNRAENIMIADLLRNDLGRIGTDIAWRDLFKVTAYKTLFQMTSTVTAKVAPDKAFSTLLSAIFPSGSVTGAPKYAQWRSSGRSKKKKGAFIQELSVSFLLKVTCISMFPSERSLSAADPAKWA